MTSLYGCIEAGGTKFVLGLIDSARAIVARTQIPTHDPESTLAAAFDWFGDAQLEAIGIASFGPVRIDHAAPDWGHILDTPKPGWRGIDLAGAFAQRLRVPVGLDTDVNGAAIAESRWGAAIGSMVSAYVTVGTGIGGGAVFRGHAIGARNHPEMGHFYPAPHPEDRDFAGICPFHGRCLEGLASGPAIKARWGASLSELPADHIGHMIIAHYLAQMAVMLAAVLAPERIVIGGGVLGTPGLMSRIRAEAAQLGGPYLIADADTLIMPPALGNDAGLFGAFALAESAKMLADGASPP